jgi:ElaB/YqjD/DUF883 family membrane-anchored ribosome-binding protein
MAAAEMMESLKDAVSDGTGDVSKAAAAARESLEDVESQARSFIREYPLASLAAAVVAGYLVARLLPRF